MLVRRHRCPTLAARAARPASACTSWRRDLPARATATTVGNACARRTPDPVRTSSAHCSDNDGRRLQRAERAHVRCRAARATTRNGRPARRTRTVRAIGASAATHQRRSCTRRNPRRLPCTTGKCTVSHGAACTIERQETCREYRCDDGVHNHRRNACTARWRQCREGAASARRTNCHTARSNSAQHVPAPARQPAAAPTRLCTTTCGPAQLPDQAGTRAASPTARRARRPRHVLEGQPSMTVQRSSGCDLHQSAQLRTTARRNPGNLQRHGRQRLHSEQGAPQLSEPDCDPRRLQHHGLAACAMHRPTAQCPNQPGPMSRALRAATRWASVATLR